MKSIIHVNRHHIAANAKDGLNRRVYTIKQGKKTIYGREVHILGPSKLVYSSRGLSCGARAWIETTSPIEIVDPCSYEESLRE